MKKNSMAKVLAACFILGLLVAGLLYPIHHDEGVFLTMGVGWKTGLLPYRDLFDHKPPGIYVVTRFLSYFVHGWQLIVLARVFIFGVNLATSLMLVELVKAQKQKVLLLVPLVYLSLALYFHGHFFMTAAYANLFLVLGWLLFFHWMQRRRSRWLVFAGIALAMAGMFKQPYMLQLLPLLVVIVVIEKSWRQRLMFSAFLFLGYALVWLGWWSYAFQYSIAAEAWQAWFGFHLSYQPAGLTTQFTWMSVWLLPLILIWLVVAKSLIDWLFLLSLKKLQTKDFDQIIKLIVFGSLALMLPFSLYRPYHHYWFQLLPMVVLAFTFETKKKAALADFVLGNALLVGGWFTTYGFFSSQQFLYQIHEADTHTCEQATEPYHYVLTNCMPTKNYFYMPR